MDEKIKAQQDARSATAYLKIARARTSFQIGKLLTDNDKPFTDRLCYQGQQPN